MKPNQKLIDALWSAADRIQHSGEYRWDNSLTCNCGILVQEILDIDTSQLQDRLVVDMAGSSWGGLWSDRAQRKCSATGLPESRIVYVLRNYGLSAQDIFEIEFLGNPQSRVVRDFTEYTNRNVVASWMRQRAIELEKQLRLESNSRAISQPQVTTQADKVPVRQKAF